MDTSYLTTQVSTIVGQLHSLFDEIGVPSHERESRESNVSISVPRVGRALLMALIAVQCAIRDPAQSITLSDSVSHSATASNDYCIDS